MLPHRQVPQERKKFTPVSPHPREDTAFTLLEVMIASGIFFMAIFAILALVSSNLRNARLLQRQQVDAGLLLADLCQTNQLTEGSDSGDFGDAFPGFTWTCDITLVATNGLFKVDYIVTRPGGGPNSETTMSALLFRPDSQKSPGR
jgi:Tfp pilus assembly protein PilV